MSEWDDLANTTIATFGESVEIRRPVQGPLDPMAGTRTTTHQTVRVLGSVGRTRSEQVDEQFAVEEVVVSVRVRDVPFHVTAACELRIIARDSVSQWRQITLPDVVVGGTMYEIPARRKR